MIANNWKKIFVASISLCLVLLIMGLLIPGCNPQSSSPTPSTISSPSRNPTSTASATTPSILTSSPNQTATALLPGITTNAPNSVSASNIPATCPTDFVIELTEGPYYKAGSPQRTELIEAGVVGTPLTLTGYVFDKNCMPISGAWLDFWQADGNGNYDNNDYKLRGYQLTDAQGKYILHTVFPGLYPGRTEHIHVKLNKSEALPRSESAGSIVTTQLFFPGSSQNSSDSIFDPSMVVKLGQSSDGQYIATFNFKLNQ